MRKGKAFILVLSMLLLNSCGVKFDLPTQSSRQDPISGAGRKTYIRVSPNWDAAHGYDFAEPWDVLIGADGYLFVADRQTSRIHVISSAGRVVSDDAYGNDFRALDDLGLQPHTIAQDETLNLFVADSSNRIFVWNQYLANVGIDSVASSVQLRSSIGDLKWLEDIDSVSRYEAAGWSIVGVHWTAEGTEDWVKPRVFWDATDSLEASRIRRYFINPDSIRITGLAAREGLCLVADAFNNAILTLAYKPVALLKTRRDNEILVYGASIMERTVSSGTGNGTVNDPRGMVLGTDGAIYYTQWGKNFGVHKVGGESGFEYGEDDIMEIDRFNHPSDITLDQTANIYVADTEHNLVQQFNPDGSFAYNIGTSLHFIDSTLTDSIQGENGLEIVSRDTVLQIEAADVLRSPRAIAVDANGIVYIADTGNQRIMRFRLSTDLDYETAN